MVDFFFVLSGFVIALNFQSKIYNFTDVINFQARRFFRLYPLHFFMLLIYLCLCRHLVLNSTKNKSQNVVMSSNINKYK